MGSASQTLAQALSNYHVLFADAFSNLGTAAERRWYATVIVSRLILIYDLQVAGFLGEGDRWYLHTKLGQFSETQPGEFFKRFLKPLCHQGLALPVQEWPRALQQTIGAVPYLGSRPFQPYSLEHRVDVDLPDDSIEQFLGWLAEQPWSREWISPQEPDSITRSVLAEAYEYVLAAQFGRTVTLSSEVLEANCKLVDAHILKAIQVQVFSTNKPMDSLDAILTKLDDETCQALVGSILPSITILDLACGAGCFLGSVLRRLQHVYQCCWKHAQVSSNDFLRDWVRLLKSTSTSPEWTWTYHILTHNLFGLDAKPEATLITQFQLWLMLLSTANVSDDLSPLPDLDFSITTGNALVGFIHVDEESFDQIRPKRMGKSSAFEAKSETILQGDLLQPLAAASYRDTLAEKKIRVEHYRAQTRAMGLEGGIPDYVQTEFLRDRIDDVNQAVQQKLNRLLFETFSRKLGIKIQDSSLSGKAQPKRLLSLEDIEALHPFHWGFCFDVILEQQGGFDIVLAHYPTGTLRPKIEEFYNEHRDLFQKHQIEWVDFKRSRRDILKKFPDLAHLWNAYTGKISCIKDYVRRSHDYQLPISPTAGRSIFLDELYSQRCRVLRKVDS
ncbi:hypothetical protein PN498_23900 [Oscillatoria sp. CS-180]|uniref:hypothetical protein n=1 Tax=Oscillatoria sp. CS-180 TaxID=3021720 RepID=UPI00232CFA1A|nr:hypothetical protein [Oscillatoria sp. CS-180]MDB9529058.1 hypothetical protein [Oscillatoria sp. CS-180]